MLQVVIKYNYLPNMTVNRNKESWLRGIHPQPLCPYAKTKIKFVHYRKVVSLRRDKKKSIHHITRHIRLWLFTKASTQMLRTSDMPIRCAKSLAPLALFAQWAAVPAVGSPNTEYRGNCSACNFPKFDLFFSFSKIKA